MPTLEITPNITEGDKRLSTIHHIVDLKQYTEAMSNSLHEINELANQLPPSDISETIERHISLLVSVHRKVIIKVSMMSKDLNCKSAVNSFYTNQNAEQNKINRINNMSHPSSPVKRKASNIEILENILVTDHDNSFAIVTSKRQQPNIVSPTKNTPTRCRLPSRILPFPVLPSPRNGKYYSLSEALMVYEHNYKNWSVNHFFKETKKRIPPSLLCHKSTFYRQYNDFKSGVTPRLLDNGVSMGRPPLIPRLLIRELNDGVSNVDGEAEDYTGLGTRLVHIANK